MRELADELAGHSGSVYCVAGEVTRADDVQRMLAPSDALGDISRSPVARRTGATD